MNPKDLPLVSIVCLSMNHEKYVRQSFESVVRQTYPNIEIVYVDNNSTDNTFEIADEIFRTSGLPYKWFKIEKNYSISENLNFLIKEASGKYIAPQSGDDWWELTNLERKIAFYEANPKYGIVYCNGYYYNDRTQKKALPDTANFKTGFIFDNLLFDGVYFPVGYVVKREVFEKVGLYDEQIMADDWDMWLRVSQYYPIGYFDEPLVYYRRHDNNFCVNYANNYSYYLQTLNKYKQHPLYKKALKTLNENYIYGVVRTPSFESLKEVFKYYHFNLFYNKQLLKVLLGLFFKVKF